MGRLTAGLAWVDITPPVGTPLGGFPARFHPSQGIHDRLYAKALTLADGDETVALVATDLVAVPGRIVAGVRDLVQAKTGIAKERLMIMATHTHSGPETTEIAAEGDDRYIVSYLNTLELDLAGVVYMAWKDMWKARIGAGKGAVTIGFNRRKACGPIDPEVGVVRIDDMEGNPRAAMVNYACHGVVLGRENLQISADYPGYVSRMVEKTKGEGFLCLFTNGAGGNVNPLASKGYACPGTFRDAETLGSMVAWEALKVFESVELSDEVSVQARSVTHVLQGRRASIVEAEKWVEDQKCRVNEMREKGLKPEQVLPEEAILKYYLRNLTYAREQTSSSEVPFEVQVFKVNDVAFVAVPGELFVEIGQRIKALSRVKNTFIIGYANGFVGYLPTKEAFQEGGYEVSPTWWNKVGSEAEALIIETALRTLGG